MTITEALALLDLHIPLTQEDIKKAFRKKAMHNHPDKAGVNSSAGNATDFIRIREAYDLLQQTPLDLINHPQAWETVSAEAYIEPDTDRGKINLPNWGIFKEAENLVLLFLLFGKNKKRQPLASRGFRFFNLRFTPTPLPSQPSLATPFIQVWNTIKLLTASALMASFFVVSVVLVFGIIPGVLVFAFLYRYYRVLQQSVSLFLCKTESSLGHPDSHVRRAYVLGRLLALLLLNLVLTGLLFALAQTDFYTWFKLVLGLGFCVPVLALNLSVLYEVLYHVWLRKKQ